MNKRIVIMAGGTGGHIFPALAVAQFLQKQGWEVSWLGTKAGLESRVIPENGIEIDWLSVSGLRGKGIFSKFTAIFKLAKSCVEARRILKQRKPNIVLGMGGFVAAPGGLMAKFLGIPLIIHEQNRVVGTTNKLLAKIATKVLQGFPNSFAPSVEAICTGNPLRETLKQIPPAPLQSGELLNILVVGGSQGAKALNETVPNTIALLKNSVQIRHQTGAAMQNEVAEKYKTLNLNAEVSAFIDDMAAAYSWADLIICRAGAMTISEVAAMGIPAIFIPLSSAIDDHQTANAKYLTDFGVAILVKQSDLTAENLVQQIRFLCENLPERRAISQTLAYLNATETVAQFCIAEAKA
ncbi:UDP-N-acetylglucosamine--N-acetylmuramyl-(pentapeptide) pyrophosphoryl-undecaprenol N-acetylglucosamine transferase [Methylococcaceae bacterium]|nr:UDP-N-acetylglucosamine--N-acetylmuramyl-(pentapeptide) pyrophosphoryl-undecaprenol N-acetylglucosamine transferase [Methylococcaceae bacterium]